MTQVAYARPRPTLRACIRISSYTTRTPRCSVKDLRSLFRILWFDCDGNRRRLRDVPSEGSISQGTHNCVVEDLNSLDYEIYLVAPLAASR